jgi:hypothetical protein
MTEDRSRNLAFRFELTDTSFRWVFGLADVLSANEKTSCRDLGFLTKDGQPATPIDLQRTNIALAA